MSKRSGSEIYNRLVKKGVFPYQMAFTLLIPARNMFLSPKQLISRLDLKKDSEVLEVGPGPGYFSIHIAKVLTEGRLVLADIQQEMLEKQRKGYSESSYPTLNSIYATGKISCYLTKVLTLFFLLP